MARILHVLPHARTRARAHARGPPAAVLGFRRPSRRAVIAQAGEGGGAIAGRARRRHWPSRALHAPLRRQASRPSQPSVWQGPELTLTRASTARNPARNYPYNAAAGGATRLARRRTKVKDKWKDKKWVTVYAPGSFNNVRLAEVPITDEEQVGGRLVEVTLFDILRGDPSQYQYKIYFQMDKVDGDRATSIFKRYEYAKEFLRSLVRRGSSKVNFIIDVSTKDGYVFRIKVIMLTHTLLNTSRKHALRLIAREVIGRTVPEMTIDQFVQATCYGKINSDIMAPAKKLFKIRHVGLEKVKLIRTADEQITLLEA